MVMNPRTHRRGAPPDFALPKPNPNPDRITDALWWLRCMRLRLEPLSEDSGILAIKPGYHSYGSRLVDYGLGDSRTDHSIRRAPDRTGPWWKKYAAAHDWTFTRAHKHNYTEINLYTGRLVRAMRDPDDLRPDDVYAYTIGQMDTDPHIEGWNEYRDEDETGDDSHDFHRHDSFRRNIIGNFWAMWKALTIDMGWTYAEWLASTTEEDGMAGITQTDFNARMDAWWTTRMDHTAKTPSEPLVQLRVAPWHQGTGAGGAGPTAFTVLFGIMRDQLAKVAGVNPDDVDEAAIIAGVLAGLDPAAIAAAIPADLAQRVAEELSARPAA